MIVAGSRYHFPSDIDIENAILDSGFHVTEIVSGMSGGVDLAAVEWAERRDVSWQPFYPRWNFWREQGNYRRAGPERNDRMAEYGDALIAIWDGQSDGTRDMIEKAKRKRLPVHVVTLLGEDLEEKLW